MKKLYTQPQTDFFATASLMLSGEGSSAQSNVNNESIPGAWGSAPARNLNVRYI